MYSGEIVMFHSPIINITTQRICTLNNEFNKNINPLLTQNETLNFSIYFDTTETAKNSILLF